MNLITEKTFAPTLVSQAFASLAAPVKSTFKSPSVFAISAALMFLMLMSSVQAAEIRIGSLVTTHVERVDVKVGDRVKAGQSLIRLNEDRFQASLTRLQADVRYRELALADAQIEFDQIQDLYDRAVIPRRTFERAQLDLNLAQQALTQAQAELALQQTWQPYFHIKAPVAARVSEIKVAPGTTVYKENQLMIILEAN